MCGITGWMMSKAACAAPEILERMNDAVAHRGPDGSGVFFAKTKDGGMGVALAHRRLAIIDLAGGEQPMRSEDGLVALTFNGEIYNYLALRDELTALGYAFATHSDTEVLLNAYREWGEECVERLRGMFAFAVWDAGRERLFLARDRFGKKPLFLWQNDDGLLFASEIKSLLAHPAVAWGLDAASVRDYLQYRYVPGPNTLFTGVKKLEPGSWAVYKGGQLTTQSYYTPPDATMRPGRDPGDAEAVAAFSKLLDECVRLRMASDVPFGAFLSGGLDSSAVVALMQRHSMQAINTFTIGFEEDTYSEIRYARAISKQFGTKHHELLMKAEDIVNLLPEAIAYHDAPMAEPSDIAMYVLSKETAKSVKMVLTGEGADEILAGYPKHGFEPYAQLYQRMVPRAVQATLIDPLAARLPARFYRLLTLAQSLGIRDEAERMPRWFGALSLAECAGLLALDAPPRELSARPFAAAPGQSLLRRILCFDQTSWLPDNLLERGDRMMMAASIEGRMPFLDHELAAFVSCLPDRYRLRGRSRKWLLREAMKPVLPPDILARRKVGFRLPVSLWFQTTLKEYVHHHLLGPDSATRDFYHRPRLAAMLGEHASGRRNHEKLIWTLLNLELFQKRYALTACADPLMGL